LRGARLEQDGLQGHAAGVGAEFGAQRLGGRRDDALRIAAARPDLLDHRVAEHQPAGEGGHVAHRLLPVAVSPVKPASSSDSLIGSSAA
jgi:hypothetical protein